MWAQSWSGLDYLALPYPNTTFPDVTAELLEKVHVRAYLVQHILDSNQILVYTKIPCKHCVRTFP